MPRLRVKVSQIDEKLTAKELGVGRILRSGETHAVTQDLYDTLVGKNLADGIDDHGNVMSEAPDKKGNQPQPTNPGAGSTGVQTPDVEPTALRASTRGEVETHPAKAKASSKVDDSDVKTSAHKVDATKAAKDARRER